MFLNDISIYSIPIIGIVVLLIAISSSKTINLFKYQLSTKSKKQQYVDQTLNSHIAIQVNSFSQSDNVNNYRSRFITSSINTIAAATDDDDDEELIQSDISSISVSNFCDNSSIELRLDQDLDDDNDLIN